MLDPNILVLAKAMAKGNGNGSGGGVSSWNDLTDKPEGVGYKEWGMAEQASGEYMSEINTAFGAHVIYLDFYEEQSETPQKVSVTFDGVKYENLSVTVIDSADGASAVCGNLFYANALLGTSFPDTGEPFLSLVRNDGMTVMVLDGTPTRHELVVEIPGYVYRPIDSMYLPAPVIREVGSQGMNNACIGREIHHLLSKGIPVRGASGEALLWNKVGVYYNGQAYAWSAYIGANGSLCIEKDNEGSAFEEYSRLGTHDLVMSCRGYRYNQAGLGFDETGVPFSHAPDNYKEVYWKPDVLVSPNGNKFKLTVDDNGNLTTTAISE